MHTLRSLLLMSSLVACAQSGATEPGPEPETDPDASINLGPAVLANGCVEGTRFGSQTLCSGDGATCSRVVRVLSYNVYALPETIGGENPKDRMRRIGELLAEQRLNGDQPDFVLLQEAFDKEDRIYDRAGYSEIIAGPTQEIGLSSGLYALTDHPVDRVDRYSYQACAGVDCFSEKGVMALTTTPSGMPEPITILTTHMQAQSENDQERVLQINELLPFLASVDIDSRASVFAGDFNFKAKTEHASNPSYEHFMANTPYSSTGQYCLDNGSCEVVLDESGRSDENDLWWSTNDHQFFHAPSSGRYKVTTLRAAVTFTDDFEGEPLSDHWAREFDYCFSWQTED